MSMWIRTIAISVTALWLVGCSSGRHNGSSLRMLSPRWVERTNSWPSRRSLMSGGTGTRTKVGQAMTATGPDQVGELSNDVETLDLAQRPRGLRLRAQGRRLHAASA